MASGAGSGTVQQTNAAPPRVAQLEEQNAALQARVKELEMQISKQVAGAGTAVSTLPFRDAVSKPKDASEGASTRTQEMQADDVEEEDANKRELRLIEQKFLGLMPNTKGPMVKIGQPVAQMQQVSLDSTKAKLKSLLNQLKARKIDVSEALKGDATQVINGGSAAWQEDIKKKMLTLREFLLKQEKALLDYIKSLEERKLENVNTFQETLDVAVRRTKECIAETKDGLSLGQVDFMGKSDQLLDKARRCLAKNGQLTDASRVEYVEFRHLSVQSGLLQDAWIKDMTTHLAKLDDPGQDVITAYTNTGLASPLTVEQKTKRLDSLQLLIADLHKEKRTLATQAKYMEAAHLQLKIKTMCSDANGLSDSINATAHALNKKTAAPRSILPQEEDLIQKHELYPDGGDSTNFHFELFDMALDMRVADTKPLLEPEPDPLETPTVPVVPPLNPLKNEKVIASKAPQQPVVDHRKEAEAYAQKKLDEESNKGFLGFLKL